MGTRSRAVEMLLIVALILGLEALFSHSIEERERRGRGGGGGGGGGLR